MKKILALLITLSALLFCSCGADAEKNDDNSGSLPPAEHTHDFSIYGYDSFDHWCQCSGCDKFKYNESHVFENVVIIESTYTSEGSGERRCETCEHTEEYTIPVIEHTCEYELVDVENTVCGDSFRYECNLCGSEYYSNDTKQHEFVDYKCEDCGFEYVSEGVYFQVNDSKKYVRAYGAVNEDVLVIAYSLPDG